MTIFEDDFLQQLQQLHMGLSLRIHDGTQGGRRSPCKGSSLEFSDFREYSAGDDFRRIDWASYGRLDKLFIKEFMEEKEAVFHLFVDKSISMSFGMPSKGETSLKLAAAISYIAMKHQDQVRLSVLGGESDTDSARQENNGWRLHSSKQGFYQFLEKLSQITFDGTGDICKALCNSPIKARGLSIIFSDFLFEDGLSHLEKALAYLRYKKEQVILIQLLSQEERLPDELGDFELVDSETKQAVKVTLTPKLISAYKERLKQYQISLESLAQKYDATFVVVDAEDSLSKIILQTFWEKRIIF